MLYLSVPLTFMMARIPDQDTLFCAESVVIDKFKHGSIQPSLIDIEVYRVPSLVNGATA